MSSAAGRMHFDGLKARMSRLLAGDLRVDDIARIYAGLRSASFGRASFREIADFAAHPDVREKGPVTQVIRDLITTFTPFFESALGTESPQIEKLLDRVLSNLRLATDEQVLRICGRNKGATKKIAENGLAKLRNGQGSQLTEAESRVLIGLGDRLVWNPAFRGDEIFEDFKTVALKNKILEERDAAKLAPVRELLVLHAIVAMHGSAYVLENGMRGELQAGIEKGKRHLELTAAISFKGYSKPVYMNPCVVWTGIDAKAVCEPPLAERFGRWDFPIEIQRGRLGPIGDLPPEHAEDGEVFRLG